MEKEGEKDIEEGEQKKKPEEYQENCFLSEERLSKEMEKEGRRERENNETSQDE